MYRVLIVEDNDMVRLRMKIALREAGHEVHEASDGFQGLRLFQKTYFDLVITEIVLPKIDGLEMIQAFRTINPSIKIIALGDLCGHNPNEYPVCAANGGIDLLFSKPVERTFLLDAVHQVLESCPILWHE